MGAALRLVDETSSGKVLHELTLTLASERVSAREIVRQRVMHEVRAFESQRDDRLFRGLVQPTDTERELNGYRVKAGRTIDVEAQIERAWRAFDTNGFLMLVGDHQIEALDEEVVIEPDTRVSFVKLLPLVGG